MYNIGMMDKKFGNYYSILRLVGIMEKKMQKNYYSILCVLSGSLSSSLDAVPPA